MNFSLSNVKRLRRAAGALILVAGIYLAFGFSSRSTTHYKAQTAINIPYPKPLPGLTPISFLPGIVSTDSVDFNAAFSADGKSFYFTRKENGRSRILFSRYDGKDWATATPVELSGNKYSNADPAFAADGTLYFISNRPKNPSDTIASDYDIWFCKPLANGHWSEPRNLQILNSDGEEYYISFAKNGNLYFASSRKGGSGEEDLYVSRLVNGKYTAPENLGGVINSKESEYDPCISPDEDFIIFTSSTRDDSFGGADLYYSKLDAGKKWTSPVNLGKNFNTKGREYCSYFSPDHKYFFFASQGDVKWIDIRAINKLVQH